VVSGERPADAGELVTGRVLVVEDDPVNMVLVRALLEHAGHHVVSAGTVGEAEQQLADGTYDVVLLDINIPGGGGGKVVQHIRASPPLVGLQVVALTAFAMAGDRERLLGLGCDDYLSKPIDAVMLRRAIAAAITRTRSAGR
jgi:two-component system cell cycle response regulator DivK